MKTYDAYTSPNRKRMPVFQFSYDFDGIPLAGDIIADADEQWIIQHRLWIKGRCVLFVKEYST